MWKDLASWLPLNGCYLMKWQWPLTSHQPIRCVLYSTLGSSIRQHTSCVVLTRCVLGIHRNGSLWVSEYLVTAFNGVNWTHTRPLALLGLHATTGEKSLIRTHTKASQLLLIEFTFCHSVLKVNVFTAAPVCAASDGFVKSPFMTANYQRVGCSLENECNSGINLHLNIWCPDNKIFHQRNAIYSCSTQIVIRLTIKQARQRNLTKPETISCCYEMYDRAFKMSLQSLRGECRSRRIGGDLERVFGII